jgi:hypothetical protein
MYDNDHATPISKRNPVLATFRYFVDRIPMLSSHNADAQTISVRNKLITIAIIERNLMSSVLDWNGLKVGLPRKFDAPSIPPVIVNIS